MTTLSVAGNLLIGDEFVQGTLIVAGGRIAKVRRGAIDGMSPDLQAAYIAPGLIDLQVNGGFGVEVGEDPEAIAQLSKRLPESGVTSYLPTVITSPEEHYERVFEAFASLATAVGARPLGLHLEGPFLSPNRAGAHRIDLIEAADNELFSSLLNGPGVKLMTLAPEQPGALDRIHRLRQHGILVSLGHTDATYEQFIEGIDAGATMATHLYNAMSPFGHRAPGVVGAALLDDRVTVGLIADGVHSHPESIRLAVRAKGPSRIALVTDMMPAAGMPPGKYEFGGQMVTVDGISATLKDGTLAGSVVTLDQVIRNVVAWTKASPAEAIGMASETPARLLGLIDTGRVEADFVADLVLFDPDLKVEATIIGGQIAYRRERSKVG